MSSSEPIVVNTPFNKQQTLPAVALQQETQEKSLRGCVAGIIENYFQHLDGQPVTGVYDMVMQEVETPLLEAVMKNTRQNQTKAAEILGLNRGTLRKKLKNYNLL